MLKQGRYIVNRLIGRGAFGKVFEGFDRETGQKVAIKVILHRDSPSHNPSK